MTGPPGCTCDDYYAYYLKNPNYKLETFVGTRTITHPPATVSSFLQCSQPGSDGWCRGGASLSLTGSEPLAGYSILAVEGARNGVSFAFPGASAPIPLLEGQNDFTFWALSSWGDSSLMGSASGRVDTQAPGISGSLSGLSGDNGWYVSTVELSASASDSTPGSGLDTFEYALDGGPWTPYATAVSIFTGIHDIDLRAIDQAGNESTATQAIQVDAVPPQASLEADGSFCPGCGQTLSVTFSLSDATSGIAAWELKAGGTILASGTGQTAHTYQWDGSGLGAGSHSLTLNVSDRAGNTSERSVSVLLIAPTPAPGASPVPAQQPTAPASTPIPDTSSSSLPGGTQETHEPSSSNTGQDGAGSSAAPSHTPVVSIFGSAKPTPVPEGDGSSQDGVLGGGNQPPIAWGAVAMAAMGGLTAYVLDEQRKRKQTEAQQKAEVELRAAQFNAEQEQRRAEALEEQRKQAEAAAYWAGRKQPGIASNDTHDIEQHQEFTIQGNFGKGNTISTDDIVHQQYPASNIEPYQDSSITPNPYTVAIPVENLNSHVCTDDGSYLGITKTPEIILAKYGVILKNGTVSHTSDDGTALSESVEMTEEEKLEILRAVTAVGLRMGAYTGDTTTNAFKTAYHILPENPLIFLKGNGGASGLSSECSSINTGGCTSSARLINFVQLATNGTNNIVHELGHAFNASMGGAPANQLGVDMGANAMLRRWADKRRYFGFGSTYHSRPLEWQMSVNPDDDPDYVESASEIFADMFLGWVFNTWYSGESPEEIIPRNERVQWMFENMQEWMPCEKKSVNQQDLLFTHD
ncbi:MAG: hypothetical protein FJZ96_13450 [Chloroflexi bacterium]|nr:hypothetical protein [Chloroflexota bacterium]